MFENIMFGALTIIVMLLIGVIFSKDRKAIKWRTVGIGLAIDILLLIFLVKVPIGNDILKAVGNGFDDIVSFSNAGITFVFGNALASSKLGVWFIEVLMPVVFVCSLISLLTYLKVIPFLIRTVGKGLGKLLGTSDSETFSAIGNFFLGNSESPMFVAEYVNGFTESEMFVLAVSGFNSVALSILPSYCKFGGASMSVLLAICLLSPITSIVMAKIVMPETKQVDKKEIKLSNGSCTSFFDSLSHGAIQGMQISISVSAVLIAIISLVAMINGGLGHFGLNLTMIFGWVFLPLAKLLGVAPQYQHLVASTIGLKVSVNEFVAYGTLPHILHTLPMRTQVIIQSTITNFGNFSVIGIFIGAMKIFTPNRKDAIKMASLGLFVGLLASFVTTGIFAMVYA